MRRSQVTEVTLPLDLHVLGLPLAFILSQDQTLHRIFFIFFDVCVYVSLLKRRNPTLLFCMLSIQYVYERILLFLSPSLGKRLQK